MVPVFGWWKPLGAAYGFAVSDIFNDQIALAQVASRLRRVGDYFVIDDLDIRARQVSGRVVNIVFGGGALCGQRLAVVISLIIVIAVTIAIMVIVMCIVFVLLFAF